MTQKEPMTVLVAPLDWGLGHATRCIPIINELIKRELIVIIAASGSQLDLLKQAFPALEYLEIPGYKIRYKPGFLLKWSIFIQIPGILLQIQRENRWLSRLISGRSIQAVISDNRYGLYHKKIFSVFITHQLNILSGLGRKVDNLLFKMNQRRIQRFSTCWVPDFEKDFSLAGILSHPVQQLSIPVKYIGILSRFSQWERTIKKNTLLIILSGPEPQRTHFENILFSQLINSNLQIVLVRGLPGSDHVIPFIHEGVKIFNHLRTEKLNELLSESDFIIARAGYSTIMDLVRLRRKAILVPTPGQTEQEYLGKRMVEKNWMITINENEFNLEAALKKLEKSKLNLPEIPASGFESSMEELITKCRGKIGKADHF